MIRVCSFEINGKYYPFKKHLNMVDRNASFRLSIRYFKKAGLNVLKDAENCQLCINMH